MTDYYKWPCILLTGGGDGALDAIDGSLLADGHSAYVDLAATQEHLVYELDADSAAAENSPYVIAPDSNAGDKRWILMNGFIQSSTGAVKRKAQEKMRDVVSVTDFSSLANARTAAGFIRDVIDEATGRRYMAHSETFDLATNVLAVGNYWLPSATVAIGNGKNFNLYRYDATVTLGNADAEFFLHNYNITVGGTPGSANCDSYAFAGNISQAGGSDVTSKALYGRATGLALASGVIMGGVFAVTPASLQTTSVGIQVSLDSTGGSGGDGVGKIVDIGIWLTSNVSPTASSVNYGILFQDKLEVEIAGLQMYAGGDGAFLKLKNAAGDNDLFVVDKNGAINQMDGGYTPATLELTTAQAAVQFTNTTRTWQLQSVTTGDYFRLLAESTGDMLAVESNGNIGVKGLRSFGGATGGAVCIPNITAPGSSPTGGGILYVAAGALKYKGSSGTVTDIASA